jgi:anti-sigma factor RsiW
MTESAPHLTEGEAIRYLDGEGAPGERRRWAEHLDACERCARELDELGRLLNGVATSFAALDAPPELLERTRPSPRAARPHASVRAPGAGPVRWLRHAAAVLLLLLPLALVPPLRAWIVERVHGTVGRGATAPPPDPAPAPAAAQAGGRLRFVPGGEEVQVEVTAWQAAGTLTLRRWEGPAGVLEVVGGSGDEGSMVSERVLRIESAPGSTASYELDLPASVRRVVVRVGGERYRVLEGPDLAGPAVLDLRAPAPASRQGRETTEARTLAGRDHGKIPVPGSSQWTRERPTRLETSTQKTRERRCSDGT